LPVKKFIAACNANDVVPRFMRTEEYQPRESVATLSNAMDVGSPSNFVRILEIFDNKFVNLEEKLEAVSVSDETTAETMTEVYRSNGYMLDPHGAVGYRALADSIAGDNSQGIFLETAHPVKFDSVREIIGTQGEIPGSVESLFSKEKQSIEMEVNYDDLKALLLSKI
jgi:threonine synthase